MDDVKNWAKARMNEEALAAATSKLQEAEHKGADNPQNIGSRWPDNHDVRDLCILLSKLSGQKSDAEIARDFTREVMGRDKKAKNLLRQARRYRHLWKR
jgi:hypothetical protein